MAVDVSQFYRVFFEEAAEHLVAMEDLLLRLDLSAPDAEDLNALFRAAHSIKGGAGTFGFHDMAEVTHALETLLDQVRKAERVLTGEMVNACLAAGDVLKAQLAAHQHGADFDPVQARTVLASLEALNAARHEPPANATRAYRLRFSAAAADCRSVADWQSLLGRLAQIARFDAPATPAGWDVALTLDLQSALPVTELQGALEFMMDPARFRLEAGPAGESDTPANPANLGATSGVGPAPDDAADNTLTNTPAAAAADDDFGFFDDAPGAPSAACGADVTEAPEDDGFGFFTDAPGAPLAVDETAAHLDQDVASDAITATPARQHTGRRSSDDDSASVLTSGRRTGDKLVVSAQADASSIRVPVEKIDHLINLVGELVITQAMLAQTAADVDPVLCERLSADMGQLERNTRDLQEAVMSIRMMPIGFVFSRFPRVVHDVSQRLGKKVDLKLSGEGTELDKSLIEKIADPLTHLVRNSLDHGVETPEARRAAGKPEAGMLTLKAYHQGGNIVIEVGDDGGGLNREKILRKARERGMAVNEAASDAEVWQLIFEPGFSTADTVTDVSGRGVGMDVVKRNIQALGGRVDLDSISGRGTRVSIRLPLTLAILDGLSVAVGGETFILPLTFISESLQPQASELKTVSGDARLMRVRGEYLPVVALHELFHLAPERAAPEQAIMVILETEGRKTALQVDALLGQHQVVIKSLESNYRKVPNVSGATIMGDGRVALILDAAAIARMGEAGAPARLH